MQSILKRAIAYLIDCLISFSLIMLVIQWAILSNIRSLIGITDEWFINSWNMEIYVITSISLPVYLYFAYFDSNRSKGTFGKRAMKLSVREETNQRISFSKSFFRVILKLLPWEIVHIGIIFPTPMYFETEPDFRILIALGILLSVSYIISFFLNKGEVIYDRILKTKVVIENA